MQHKERKRGFHPFLLWILKEKKKIYKSLICGVVKTRLLLLVPVIKQNRFSLTTFEIIIYKKNCRKRIRSRRRNKNIRGYISNKMKTIQSITSLSSYIISSIMSFSWILIICHIIITSDHHYVEGFQSQTIPYTRLPYIYSKTSSRYVITNPKQFKESIGVVLNAISSKLSKLPTGISPFEKDLSKSLDIQGMIRTTACKAIDIALNNDNINLIEIDFPSLIGGYLSKTQFDDYDNVQELNANRDWCIQITPIIQKTIKSSTSIWFILPDDKEVELAKDTWKGQIYTKSCKMTSIRAVCELLLSRSNDSTYRKTWGSSIASTMNKFMGGDGILGDSNSLDKTLSITENRINLFCQPGNGGPVEDWINVRAIHETNSEQIQPTIVVNGSLDKVRDGYYPSIFFPALSKTISFYKQFTFVYCLKPITYQNLYGWLYRVYPEPYQVILQRTIVKNDRIEVKETIALVSNDRPTYQEIINALTNTAKTL